MADDSLTRSILLPEVDRDGSIDAVVRRPRPLPLGTRCARCVPAPCRLRPFGGSSIPRVLAGTTPHPEPESVNRA